MQSVDMDSEGKRSLPTSGSGNSDLGIEALAELIRKVVEEVLETKVKEIRETLQTGCLQCKKRKDSSSQKTEPRSMKHVKTRQNFPALASSSGEGVRAQGGRRSGVRASSHARKCDLEAADRRLRQVEQLDLNLVARFGKRQLVCVELVSVSSQIEYLFWQPCCILVTCRWMGGSSSLPTWCKVTPNHSGLGAVRDSEWPHVLQT
ncbi:Xylose operon regulatory [Gossypium arboreum]|uniref:Xylose operon regulatory n=1 Tax=Gossypium arboreum TaxID=29729 RepID=A0A0B0PKM6_GOSAR|nr:Xylose operon regulatory [Gossypium arboreum]